jgi:hypothetical protein
MSSNDFSFFFVDFGNIMANASLEEKGKNILRRDRVFHKFAFRAGSHYRYQLKIVKHCYNKELGEILANQNINQKNIFL